MVLALIRMRTMAAIINLIPTRIPTGVAARMDMVGALITPFSLDLPQSPHRRRLPNPSLLSLESGTEGFLPIEGSHL